MAIVLALLSALCYGTSDYIGGRASRHSSPLTVAVSAEMTVLPITVIAVPFLTDGVFSAGALWWGMVAGATGSIGVLGLYAALSRGSMTVVAPVTGVVAALLPVVVGLATGDRPAGLVVVGIVLAVIAVALIGGLVGALHQQVTAKTVALAMVVGALFGTLFVAYDFAGSDAGLWPLLAARFVSAPLLVGAFVVARRRRAVTALDAEVVGRGVLIGAGLALASGLYIAATWDGLLSVVAVVVSLYPASTILLASVVDHERSTRPQVLGMLLAAVAVVFVTVG